MHPKTIVTHSADCTAAAKGGARTGGQAAAAAPLTQQPLLFLSGQKGTPLPLPGSRVLGATEAAQYHRDSQRGEARPTQPRGSLYTNGISSNSKDGTVGYYKQRFPPKVLVNLRIYNSRDASRKERNLGVRKHLAGK